jgi:hypothetical protein
VVESLVVAEAVAVVATSEFQQTRSLSLSQMVDFYVVVEEKILLMATS